MRALSVAKTPSLSVSFGGWSATETPVPLVAAAISAPLLLASVEYWTLMLWVSTHSSPHREDDSGDLENFDSDWSVVMLERAL